MCNYVTQKFRGQTALNTLRLFFFYFWTYMMPPRANAPIMVITGTQQSHPPAAQTFCLCGAASLRKGRGKGTQTSCLCS